MISKLPELNAEYFRVLKDRKSNRVFAALNFGFLAATATLLIPPSPTFLYAIWMTLGSVHAGLAYSQSRRLRKIEQLNELVEKDVESPEIDGMITELFGKKKERRQRVREQRLQVGPRADLPVSGRAVGSNISQTSVSSPAHLAVDPTPDPDPPPATPGPRKIKP